MIDPITELRAAEAGLPAAESHPDPPLACFPLRTDWEQTLPLLAAAEFPPPQRTSRALPGSWSPAPVLALAQFAREHSWEVRTQYSQGSMPHTTTGKPGALKELFAVRFGAHPMTERQAYAVYSRTMPAGSWTWSSVMIWGPDLPPYGGCGVTELKQYLATPTASSVDLGLWVAGLKVIKANAEQDRKARAKTAPRKSANREGLS